MWNPNAFELAFRAFDLSEIFKYSLYFVMCKYKQLHKHWYLWVDAFPKNTFDSFPSEFLFLKGLSS